MKLKITTLCLVLICLFTLSSVSAEDSFTDLNNLIHANNNIVAINLNHDYIMNNYEANYKIGITINGAITIDAHGHTINANNLGRIFYIPYGNSLTLRNANLVNGKANSYYTDNDEYINNDGGAIYNEGTLTVIHCNFTNNHAPESSGGAILNTGCLTVIKSNFTENSARDGSGGAIYNNNGDSKVINSHFKNNLARRGGGAITSDECAKLVVGNSIFTYNSAREGGAILSLGLHLGVLDSTFRYNSAEKDGGAIYDRSGKLLVGNSIFTYNSARDGSGGAIYNTYENLAVIDNSNFTENSARDGSGGAIYNTYENLAGGSLTVIKSNFTENSARDGSGGAIINYGRLTVSESTFKSNRENGNINTHAIKEGIFSNLVVINSTFIGNINQNTNNK